jgi:hypothetical protein
MVQVPIRMLHSAYLYWARLEGDGSRRSNLQSALRLCVSALGLVVALHSASALRAEVITFVGPQDANGLTCNPAGGHCIIGDPLKYQMFSATLTSPVLLGGQWKLELETNYGTPLPGAGQVIPTYKYGFASAFAMCDFLIQWDNKYYGIVMHGHDGYDPGSLYISPNGFQTSGAVMSAQGEDSPRPNLPALLATGAAKIGNGSLTARANPGANGVTLPLYHVEATFVAPANFLNTGSFTIHACSYTCDNGYITGSRAAPLPGPDVSTPEPTTWSLALSGVVGLAWARKRRQTKRSTVQ